MKERETYPGKTYAVTSPNGCTVTTEDGTTLVEAEAGKQAYFVAVGGKVVLSDDSAILTQVFKLAPYQKLRLLGVVGGGEPAWLKALREELTAMLDGSAFELAWLAGKKQLVVHTDRVDDAMLAAVKATAEVAMPAGVEIVQYNHNMEISWRDINKYAECTNIEDMVAVNPDFKADLTSDGEWIYPLPEMENPSQRYPNNIYTDSFLSKSKVTRFAVSLPKATKIIDILREAESLTYAKIDAPMCKATDMACALTTNLQELELYLPTTKVVRYVVSDSGVQKVKIYAPLATEINMQRNKNLRVLEGEFPSLSTTGSYGFTQSQLDKESALRVLNSVPAYTSGTHLMVIGFHVDLQTDDEVLAAIANAEAKGWTLTVQWNGTATAQASVTYGLRKPPIYARLSEMERSDGTVERSLDWGHYVTDPTGYEEFRSVEAAREHYGLPEEDLTETE